MRRMDLDPSLLEGEDLEGWYLRTPDQIATERERARTQRYNDYFGRPEEARSLGRPRVGDAPPRQEQEGWQEARGTVVPSVIAPAPGGMRIGVPSEVPDAPATGSGGGFFDTYTAVPNPALGPAYYTDLPKPLNIVTPRFGGWVQLGDGSLVRMEEVERIYAEQQRMMRGEDEAELPEKVRTVDRYKDGVIPRADQLAKDEWEKDPTCHPNGGWERDPGYSTYSPEVQRYEDQIGRAPGLDYVVHNPGQNPVKFDGCAVWDPKHPLLEAKGPTYVSLLPTAERYGFKMLEKATSQIRRQSNAARGKPIELHVAGPAGIPFFRDILKPFPSIGLYLTPPR